MRQLHNDTYKRPVKSILKRQSGTAILYIKIIMNLLLTLTFCLTLSITEAFLLPREVNLGKPVKVAVKIRSHHENDDDPEKRAAMPESPKNAQEELKFLITLFQAFESHQKFVDLWTSLMNSDPEKTASENAKDLIKTAPFTPRAWFEMKRRLM